MTRGKRSDVFRPAKSGNWTANAVVGGHFAQPWAYIHGFGEAADALVDHALASHDQDLLFYPICFLYRHAFELVLKHLRVEVERLIRLDAEWGTLEPDKPQEEQDVISQLEEEHSLQRLLEGLETRLAFVDKEPIPERTRGAIIALHNMDPSGQTFRYAAKRGTPWPTLKEQGTYDLGHLRAVLTEALGLLVGMGDWLDQAIQDARSLIKEFGDYE